ncbi:GPW/gp25 family protein [uncultured Pelagimonas sp.]|uniref:GPW/gp25 family protein n=1 Tax=uncultured Pelagimonas sp. TaxID=1618102 RepID=UPI00262E59EA|nr:GPW/gp25 family protein [uncultured Pelagimonas sp.]
MQDKSKIPFQHWSLKVGRADRQTGLVGDFFGEIVSAVDDLDQSVSNLILTPLGSVPTEPEKGCDLLPYLDKPPDIAIPNIGRAIWDALTIWEPRIVLQDVKVFEVGFGHLAAEIYWRPSESILDDLRVTSLPLELASNRRVA